MISLSDYENWKTDPVTRAFFEACQDRIEDAKELLAYSAGQDPVQDNFNRGFIAAYEEIKQFRVDFEEVNS